MIASRADSLSSPSIRNTWRSVSSRGIQPGLVACRADTHDAYVPATNLIGETLGEEVDGENPGDDLCRNDLPWPMASMPAALEAAKRFPTTTVVHNAGAIRAGQILYHLRRTPVGSIVY